MNMMAKAHHSSSSHPCYPSWQSETPPVLPLIIWQFPSNHNSNPNHHKTHENASLPLWMHHVPNGGTSATSATTATIFIIIMTSTMLDMRRQVRQHPSRKILISIAKMLRAWLMWQWKRTEMSNFLVEVPALKWGVPAIWGNYKGKQRDA